MRKTIKIQDKEYVIENDNLLALMKYEEITGKNALTNTNQNLTDTVYMLYAILVTCNNDFNINLNDFKSLLNDDKSVLQDYFKFLGENIVENKKKVIAKPVQKK